MCILKVLIDCALGILFPRTIDYYRITQLKRDVMSEVMNFYIR